MFIFLKTLHFLALWVAGGAGVGGWVIQAVHKSENTAPSIQTFNALKKLGVLAFLSIAVLWVTGYGMMKLQYGVGSMESGFYIKLFLAGLILLGSLSINLMALRASAEGAKPDEKQMFVLQWLVRLSLVGVLVATAATFA